MTRKGRLLALTLGVSCTLALVLTGVFVALPGCRGRSLGKSVNSAPIGNEWMEDVLALKEKGEDGASLTNPQPRPR